MICSKKLNIVIVIYCLCENKWFKLAWIHFVQATHCSVCEQLVVGGNGTFCDCCSVSVDSDECLEGADNTIPCKPQAQPKDEELLHHWVKGATSLNLYERFFQVLIWCFFILNCRHVYASRVLNQNNNITEYDLRDVQVSFILNVSLLTWLLKILEFRHAVLNLDFSIFLKLNIPPKKNRK